MGFLRGHADADVGRANDDGLIFADDDLSDADVFWHKGIDPGRFEAPRRLAAERTGLLARRRVATPRRRVATVRRKTPAERPPRARRLPGSGAAAPPARPVQPTKLRLTELPRATE